MLRSGNLCVAEELGRSLSANTVFGVEYLELTKGVGHELTLAGRKLPLRFMQRDTDRHTFSNAQLVRLPRCETISERRRTPNRWSFGILVDIEIAGTGFVVATHTLTSVNNRAAEQDKMRAMPSSPDARLKVQQDPGRAAIVGGDLTPTPSPGVTRVER